MDSMTKNGVSASTIDEMTRRAFGEKPSSIEEVCDGFFSAVYKLTLDDSRRVVLKIAPGDDIRVQRYEQNIMAAEVSALKKVAELDYVPAPHVLFYDSSKKIVNSEYFFMEFMPGKLFSKVCGKMPVSKQSEIYTQAGIYAYKINSVTSDYFGSLSIPQKQYKTWGGAFISMIGELLRDADENGVVLPVSAHRIKRRMEEEAGLLDTVKKPALLHKDLWIGNMLVDTVNAEITGIIDFERAIFGDPLLEPVCAQLDENENFICSFTSGRAFDKAQLVRMSLYKIYLGLLLAGECAIRHYQDESIEKFADERIFKGITEFEKYTGEKF